MERATFQAPKSVIIKATIHWERVELAATDLLIGSTVTTFITQEQQTTVIDSIVFEVQDATFRSLLSSRSGILFDLATRRNLSEIDAMGSDY